MEFKLGQKFASWSELEKFKKLYGRSADCRLSVYSSLKMNVNNRLKYRKIEYRCSLGGGTKSKGKGLRHKKSKKVGCPMLVQIVVPPNKTFLQVTKCIIRHTKECEILRGDDCEKTSGNDASVVQQKINDEAKDLMDSLHCIVLSSSNEEKQNKLKVLRDLKRYWKSDMQVTFIVNATCENMDLTPCEIKVFSEAGSDLDESLPGNSNQEGNYDADTELEIGNAFLSGASLSILEPKAIKKRGRRKKQKKYK